MTTAQANFSPLSFQPAPVRLQGQDITLRPLSLEDVEGFYQAGKDPILWQWVLPNQCLSPETARSWIEYSLQQQTLGNHVPFVIIDNRSAAIIGSTRYCSIRREDRNVEIGFTFIDPNFQRSYVNTQAKYLLLRHAFEQLGAIRVELRTHEKNHQSRTAIARIGAKFEGILRNNRILSDGSYRNSAMFSVIESEWPACKAALEDKMARCYDK
ncbi:GNAT family N-acetyltransferase [Thalassomonas haliotis]|uniref:GNAT family N-acetyltransferase n=1 Tax=Thalassomonas haliotis TaxID=485448 RepID=A0ABY7VEL2_9GAMM|nr:GNAT family N-acetyltransferase [Thalassomonas haliotis]WDE12155.1 GNAT family N-acetyltransferase [Thalassomonas haliotis]